MAEQSSAGLGISPGEPHKEINGVREPDAWPGRENEASEKKRFAGCKSRALRENRDRHLLHGAGLA